MTVSAVDRRRRDRWVTWDYGKNTAGGGSLFSNISGVYNLIRHKCLRNNCSGCNYNAITQSIAWIQLKALCEEYHSGLQNHFQQVRNGTTQECFELIAGRGHVFDVERRLRSGPRLYQDAVTWKWGRWESCEDVAEYTGEKSRARWRGDPDGN